MLFAAVLCESKLELMLSSCSLHVVSTYILHGIFCHSRVTTFCVFFCRVVFFFVVLAVVESPRALAMEMPGAD